MDYRRANAIKRFSIFILLTMPLLLMSGMTKAAPIITSPEPSEPLSVHENTFSWEANGTDSISWWFYAGSSLGARNYFDSGQLAQSITSTTISTLPADGSIVYTRLWYKPSATSSWQSVDAQFTAGTTAPPEITLDTTGEFIEASNQPISWTDNGSPITQWWLYAGTAAGRKDLHDSGELSSSVTTATIDNLTLDGSSVYVKLWYKSATSGWEFTERKFDTINQLTPPSLTEPATGTDVTSPLVLSWQDNGTSIQNWWLYAGTAEGQKDLYDSGTLASDVTTVTLDTIPTDGRAVHIKLWYKTATSSWNFIESSFTTLDSSAPPSLITPDNGAEINSPQTFTWQTNGTSVTGWWLYIGEKPGAKDILDSGFLSASNLSFDLTDVPRLGKTVYAQLWYRDPENNWKFAEYTFETAPTVPDLSDYELVFSEEFSGAELDETKWHTGLLWGPYEPINNEEQLYIDSLGMHADLAYSPFELTGTSLKITATEVTETEPVPPRPDRDSPLWKPNYYSEYRYNETIGNPGDADYNPGFQEDDINYLSGIITSYGSFKMTHGYVEARAKLPAGRGLWPAFWMLPIHYVKDVPEIDVMEFLGQDVDTLYHTYHYFDVADNWRLVSTPSYTTKADDWTTDFHTYGMAWSPEQIVWYVDGVETSRVSGDDYKIANQAMYLIANVAVGGNWPGSPDDSTVFPATFEIDYIRAYKKRLSTELDIDNDYQLAFEDEFNGSALDPEKWTTHFLWGPYFPINNEEQYYVDALGSDAGGLTPFSLNDGILSITARKRDDPEGFTIPERLPEPNDSIWTEFSTFQQNLDYSPGNYTSGIITSYQSFSFVHGYAEIRAKIPQGDGLWPAFWLLNKYYVGPQPEIDIMEALGEDPTKIHHSYHRRNQDGALVSNTSSTTGGDPATGYSDGFHTYGVRWQHGKIEWYIDREKVFTYESEDVSYQVMYVIANLAIGGNFNSKPVDESLFPTSFDIDYIRVWQEKDVE